MCWVESGEPGCVTRESLLVNLPTSLSDFLRLAAESAGPGQVSKMHPEAGWKHRGQQVARQHVKTCWFGERHRKWTVQRGQRL